MKVSCLVPSRANVCLVHISVCIILTLLYDSAAIPLKSCVLQQAFEASGLVREGCGNVLTLFGEECGLALWMVSPNTWETVFFHRSNTTLDAVPLTHFDLQESLVEGKK